MTRWSAKGRNDAPDKCGENCNWRNVNAQGAFCISPRPLGDRISKYWLLMSAWANVTGSNKTSITEQTHFMRACTEQLFQFLLHLLTDTSVWLMKRVKMREIVPAQSISATTWPCSASRPSASRPSLLPQHHQGHYPPPHPRPICVVQPSVLNRSPLTGQPRNMSTSASRPLLDFFFIWNYWFAARNCMTTLQHLQAAKNRCLLKCCWGREVSLC